MANRPEDPRDNDQPREDVLSWDDYFMATALLDAKKSRDPSTQVGACIVDENKRIIGTGYNSMPNGCNDYEFPWGRTATSDLEKKYFYVCHAELNAIMNSNGRDVKNCTMYVTLHPCNECAKIIIQSGIRQVFYESDKYAEENTTKAAKRMFKAAGINCKQYTPKDPTVAGLK